MKDNKASNDRKKKASLLSFVSLPSLLSLERR